MTKFGRKLEIKTIIDKSLTGQLSRVRKQSFIWNCTIPKKIFLFRLVFEIMKFEDSLRVTSTYDSKTPTIRQNSDVPIVAWCDTILDVTLFVSDI